MNVESVDPLLVTKDARWLIGIGTTKLYELINDGALEVVKTAAVRLSVTLLSSGLRLEAAERGRAFYAVHQMAKTQRVLVP